MSDRVHPAPPEKPATEHSPELPDSSMQQFVPKPAAPPGSYVIQVPKDQVYRVPPPENAHRFEIYTRRSTKTRRSACCRCLLWTLLALLILAVAAVVAGGVLYLVYRPKVPHYSIEGLSVKHFNLSSSAALSPEIDATVRADNPNRHIGFYYRSGSDITVSYDGVTLCDGVWPTFFQGSPNVTVFQTALTASGLILSSSTHQALLSAQKRQEVPLNLDVKIPVRVKFGTVTTWTFTVKVRCQITVDKMAADAKILSNSCSVKVKL